MKKEIKWEYDWEEEDEKRKIVLPEVDPNRVKKIWII